MTTAETDNMKDDSTCLASSVTRLFANEMHEQYLKEREQINQSSADLIEANSYRAIQAQYFSFIISPSMEKIIPKMFK